MIHKLDVRDYDMTDVRKPMVEFRKYVLDNGLKVILARNNKIPSVVINTTYKVGSKDEMPEVTGLAHLLEHLLFEETANTSSGEFDTLLQSRGGESNAYTSNDITNYFMLLPSNQLEFGLWLDSDRMAGFGVTSESLEVQKKVIHEEKLLYCDNAPYGSVDEISSKLLFPDCAYKWPVIGDVENLMQLSLGEVEKFYSKYYSPSNAILTITGDIDYSTVPELVNKYYGTINSNGAIHRTEFGTLRQTLTLSETVPDNVNLPSDFIFYLVPEKNTREYIVGNLLSFILSYGESSLLYKELVYKGDLVSDIDLTYHALEKAGTMSLALSGYADKPIEKAVEKFDNIIGNISAGYFENSLIDKAKNQVMTMYCNRNITLISTADQLANYEFYFNDPEKINTSIYDYLSVSKNELTMFAKKFLRPDNRIRLSYIPKNKK
ncbi:MAG: processing peptidase [Chlorobi bacterium OLB4]|jgi:Predicted Zn-dependent peptidases|nr:MAG: processing peptidase [Chlorobi bacterium OLB4]MBW7856093.1 insulinase family protein [Ignavibacteria bacterium]OQY78093.1 MAG: hypothetical protein B6D43_06150 [Ignavibacteriales bacterium UTCHB1]